MSEYASFPEPWPDNPDEVPRELTQEEGDEIARRLFPRLDWHELWTDDTEEEWIHEPLLPARRSVVIYSPPKVGKSLLALELAVAVSMAREFLGFRPDRRRRVLYVDFENDPRGDVRSRLQAMGFGPDDLDHLDYLSFPTMGGLDTERGALELMSAVHAYGSQVVIIDTVSRAVVGEENSNDTWLGLYRRTGLRLKQAGVGLLRLDHTGKDESKGQRGGSAKSGDVDAIWRLTKVTEERFRLECTDSRLVIPTKSLHLTRHTFPRLHHTVDLARAVPGREARIRHLIELADSNGLPADTGRDGIKELAKGRGIKARTDLFAEVAKRRKEAAGPVPEPGDSDPLPDLSPTTETAGDSDPHVCGLTCGNTCPRPVGTVGDSANPSPLSPSPLSMWGQGTTGQNGDDERPTCRRCPTRLGRSEVAAGMCPRCQRIAERENAR